MKRIALVATLGLGVLASGCHVDMWRQPKALANGDSDFFSDRQVSRPTVDGTIARDMLRPENGYNTGKENGKPIPTIPAQAVSELGGPKEFLERGQQRYNVYCSPCHGELGNGNGFIAQRGMGFWQKLPASLMQKRLIDGPQGHIYDVIVNGKGAMYGYATRINDINDRWAIVGYVRALQVANGASPVPVAVAEPTPAPVAEATPAPAPSPVVAATPAPVVSAAPSAAEIKEEQEAIDKAMAGITGDVLFDTAAATLKPEARSFLTKLAAVMVKYPKERIEIGGHTDSQGNPAKNQALSQSRAEAVRTFLTSKGVVASGLTAKGYGQTVPAADNGTSEGRAKNRRISIKVLGGAK